MVQVLARVRGRPVSDWYARKLAELQGRQSAPAAPQQQPMYAPPPGALAPGQLPPHLAPYALPQPPQQVVQQPMPGAPQYPGQQPQYTSFDANTGAQVADDGTIAALAAAAQTGGSTVVKSNSTSCPNCGGGNYFTIQEGGVFSKAVGGRVNAMQCADCGYPQVQAGSQGGALQGARSGGPARSARQLPRDHRVSVIGEGGQTLTFDAPSGR